MLNFLLQHIKFFSELSSPGNLLKAFRKLCVLFKHILKNSSSKDKFWDICRVLIFIHPSELLFGLSELLLLANKSLSRLMLLKLICV